MESLPEDMILEMSKNLSREEFINFIKVYPQSSNIIERYLQNWYQYHLMNPECESESDIQPQWKEDYDVDMQSSTKIVLRKDHTWTQVLREGIPVANPCIFYEELRRLLRIYLKEQDVPIKILTYFYTGETRATLVISQGRLGIIADDKYGVFIFAIIKILQTRFEEAFKKSGYILLKEIIPDLNTLMNQHRIGDIRLFQCNYFSFPPGDQLQLLHPNGQTEMLAP